MSLLNSLVTFEAKRIFKRALRFNEECGVLPDASTARKRLIYIHVPFCESLCPYCSFHRVPFNRELCRLYFSALRKEISLYRERGYLFHGVYVGGGTPTIMVEELAETLSVVRRFFPIREVSVETNPNHLNDRHIKILKEAGVDRLSVGVQSFNDKLLREMGRFDNYGSGAEIAHRVGSVVGSFPTINADMMFNFPSQTTEMLNNDLNVLLSLGLDQITYYPLMVSDSTKEQVERAWGRVRYDKEESFYKRITGILLDRYTFSTAWCFTKGSSMVDEYIVDYDEYAGVGSGSIGYLEGVCYANNFNIPLYISIVEENRLPIFARRVFGIRDRVRYDFLMRLFSTSVPIGFFVEKYGSFPWFNLLWELVAFALAGCIRFKNGAIVLTERGRYIWVVLMREFFTAVNNFRDFCRRQR
ncbi:MAG: coproporphyrinogen III oxidase family protein [Syntrophales bacterium]|nr:coproporphyrinogen III oxidase family protein [Syntrophales bacterium]